MTFDSQTRCPAICDCETRAVRSNRRLRSTESLTNREAIEIERTLELKSSDFLVTQRSRYSKIDLP